jgi:acyl-CoA hydrolase
VGGTPDGSTTGGSAGGVVVTLGDGVPVSVRVGLAPGPVEAAVVDGEAASPPAHAASSTSATAARILETGRTATVGYDARVSDDPVPAPKPPSASAVTISQLMEVTDANIAGNVHGGAIMRLVDTAAALAAIRHAGGLCVTVSIDEMSFLEPVHIGDVVTFLAMVNDVGTTSLECGVRVEAENPVTGERVHASSAYLVFVAIDEDGNPRRVPPIAPETDEDRRRQHEAHLRRQARTAHREAVKAVRAGSHGGAAS